MPPMITVANANRSTVFEPNDLLLPAAYEAVENALWAKKEVQVCTKFKLCEETHL